MKFLYKTNIFLNSFTIVGQIKSKYEYMKNTVIQIFLNFSYKLPDPQIPIKIQECNDPKYFSAHNNSKFLVVKQY